MIVKKPKINLSLLETKSFKEAYLINIEVLELHHEGRKRPKPSEIEKLFYLCINMAPTLRKGWEILPQHPFQIDENLTYHADFFLRSAKIKKGIIIELDGHEFHEKTKEQAKKDKKRDRDLQKTSHVILHFTGSEIWNEYDSVGTEILSFIDKIEKGEL